MMMFILFKKIVMVNIGLKKAVKMVLSTIVKIS
ncbi:hypothetical protein SAMN04488114_12113 [Carnobacterium iners]|nr:hypothetical protein SAMN04488114_12113 [Carnobacterium iners]